MIIKLPNVRLSYPHLFTPTDYKGDGKLKYKASFIVPKNSEHHEMINRAITKIASEKWPKGEHVSVLEIIKNNPQKFCYLDADVHKRGEDGHKESFFLRAKNKLRPLVQDSDGTPLAEKDGRIYAGCFVHASIELWAQDSTNWGKAINATLRAVRFYRDGLPFTAGAPPALEDEFNDLDVGGLVDDLV